MLSLTPPRPSSFPSTAARRRTSCTDAARTPLVFGNGMDGGHPPAGGRAPGRLPPLEPSIRPKASTLRGCITDKTTTRQTFPDPGSLVLRARPSCHTAWAVASRHAARCGLDLPARRAGGGRVAEDATERESGLNQAKVAPISVRGTGGRSHPPLDGRPDLLGANRARATRSRLPRRDTLTRTSSSR